MSIKEIINKHCSVTLEEIDKEYMEDLVYEMGEAAKKYKYRISIRNFYGKPSSSKVTVSFNYAKKCFYSEVKRLKNFYDEKEE